ncbi:hypothetical protein OEZ86_004668 [Tetradesmus obliquus]|nr:hypothetical protein OEZ86_004668 [Tetradesmus obliquus]
MTQQLEQSGLLRALPAAVQASTAQAAQGMQAEQQQQQQLQQQQQQQQQQQRGDWRVFWFILSMLQSLINMWHCVAEHNPAMLRTVLPAVLPLLQALQASGPLIPAVAVSTPVTGSSAAGSSSSSSSSSSSA